jgi:hypothetical protein
MRHFLPLLPALWLLVSCGASSRRGTESAAAEIPPPPPQPMVILRAGEFPLWFQFTEAGPVLLESIEDARLSAALIPWPLAPHIRFALCRGEELLLGINRDGCIRIAPWEEGGLGLYYYPGGGFWRQYTLGGFGLYGGRPAALLYLDDRFLDSGASLPWPRVWTFGGESNDLLPLALPALDAFPVEEGWDADTLRLAPDGCWYYRLFRKNREQSEARMFRGADLEEPGEEVSLAIFQNSAAPAPLAAAPAPLREALELIFAFAGDPEPGGTVSLLSPEFPQERVFAAGPDSTRRLSAWWQGGEEQYLALALLPEGGALRITKEQGGAKPELSPFSLPPLPEGFIYTRIASGGDAIFAAWEEQAEYSTGAAGFMVIKR